MVKRKAYTLVEVIVVIAILGIILAITVPNSGYLKTVRENMELKEFKRDILFARNKAIMESKIYTLKLMNVENGYSIKSSSELDYSKIKYFENGIVLNKSNKVQNVFFNSNGTVACSGTISLHDRNGKEYKLTITPVRGLIDIKDADR